MHLINLDDVMDRLNLGPNGGVFLSSPLPWFCVLACWMIGSVRRAGVLHGVLGAAPGLAQAETGALGRSAIDFTSS